MAATFNPALTSNVDKVRFKVGDVDTAKAVIQDETILALLAEDGSTVASVSAEVAQRILAIYQHRVTYDVDGQGERFSDLAKNYAVTVASLIAAAGKAASEAANADAIARAVAVGGGIMPMGVRTSDNIARSEDPDRAANFSPRYRL